MTDTHDVDTGADFDAASAFEGLLGGDEPKRPEDDNAQAGGHTEDTHPEHVENHEGSTETPAPEPRAALAAADDDEFELAVNGETKRVAVKDLKAAFERNEEITRQTAEIEARRQAVDAESTKYNLALQSLAQNALARYNEYAKIDWVDARLSLTPEQYQSLRAEAGRVAQEAQYFEGQISEAVQQQRDTQLAALREQATHAVKVLKDPATGIPGWNDALYNDIQNYAVNTLGAPREKVQAIVDPWAIKALHAAMMYQKGQAALKGSPATAKPVVPASGSRPVTSTTAPDRRTPTEATRKAALVKQREYGDIDSTAAAFMAIL